MESRLITLSIISHKHCDDVCSLLEDIALHAKNDVAAIIVTINVPEERLSQWIKKKNWPFEILLVENTSPLGYGLNHNQAFSLCKTSLFCVVNPDIRMYQNPFPALVKAVNAKDVGCAYPLQFSGNSESVDMAREAPTPLALWHRYFSKSYKNKKQEPDWVNGAFMLFHSAIFAEIGGFDVRYFMYCEDVDICLRLKIKKWSIALARDTEVEHKANHASHRKIQHFGWHFSSLLRLWFSKSFYNFIFLNRMKQDNSRY